MKDLIKPPRQPKPPTGLNLITLINGGMVSSNLIKGLKTRHKYMIGPHETPDQLILILDGADNIHISTTSIEEANTEAKRIAALLK